MGQYCLMYKAGTNLVAQWLRLHAPSAGGLGLIPGSGRSPGEGNDNPLQYLLPGKSHGHSPQGRRVGHD